MGSCAVHIEQKIYTSQNTEWEDNTPRLYLILALLRVGGSPEMYFDRKSVTIG